MCKIWRRYPSLMPLILIMLALVLGVLLQVINYSQYQYAAENARSCLQTIDDKSTCDLAFSQAQAIKQMASLGYSFSGGIYSALRAIGTSIMLAIFSAIAALNANTFVEYGHYALSVIYKGYWRTLGFLVISALFFTGLITLSLWVGMSLSGIFLGHFFVKSVTTIKMMIVLDTGFRLALTLSATVVLGTAIGIAIRNKGFAFLISFGLFALSLPIRTMPFINRYTLGGLCNNFFAHTGIPPASSVNIGDIPVYAISPNLAGVIFMVVAFAATAGLLRIANRKTVF